jgi:hypothetical protein
MKKIVSIIGIAGVLCLFPHCKKDSEKPEQPATPGSKQQSRTTAQLHAQLTSKLCVPQQEQYDQVILKITGAKVYNTVYGWEELVPMPSGADLVTLQTAPLPIIDFTEYTTVHEGLITKITLTFSETNQLTVNDRVASCYKLAYHEMTLDIEGEIHAGTFNEILLGIDICGNISVETRYQQEPCYTLNQVMEFKHFNTL